MTALTKDDVAWIAVTCALAAVAAYVGVRLAVALCAWMGW